MSERPKKQLPRMIAIHTNVAEALRASGFLNAGTPLETASTPLSATAPEANAFRKMNRLMDSVPSRRCLASPVCSIGGMCCTKTR